MGKRSEHIVHKKIYKGPLTMWENIQLCSNGKCKLKLQWETNSHFSDWQKFKFDNTLCKWAYRETGSSPFLGGELDGTKLTERNSAVLHKTTHAFTLWPDKSIQEKMHKVI